MMNRQLYRMVADKESGGVKDILAGFKALLTGSRQAADPPSQKRKLTRVKCDIRVDCDAEGVILAGKVLDMSVTGMRIELLKPVKTNIVLGVKYDIAALMLKGSQGFEVDTVRTRVVWCRKNKEGQVEAGVTFIDSQETMGRSWVKYMLRQLGFNPKDISDRRKHVRVRCDMTASLRASEGCGDGLVLSLGNGGFRFEGGLNLREGASVQATIGPIGKDKKFLEVAGIVVWTRKIPDAPRWKIGVQFNELPPAQAQILAPFIAQMLKESPE
ncbi:MAG: PilZ domain-containing protein [Candidatus Xenobia bacterium]